MALWYFSVAGDMYRHVRISMIGVLQVLEQKRSGLPARRLSERLWSTLPTMQVLQMALLRVELQSLPAEMRALRLRDSLARQMSISPWRLQRRTLPLQSIQTMAQVQLSQPLVAIRTTTLSMWMISITMARWDVSFQRCRTTSLRVAMDIWRVPLWLVHMFRVLWH